MATVEGIQLEQPKPLSDDDGPIRSRRPGEKRQPRRILHFSDGILEEYSTEEEEEAPPQPAVNPRNLTWMPWFRFYLIYVGEVMLWGADACGGRLASLLGITTPKYQYMLDEVYRQKALEAADKEEQEAEQRCREEVAMARMEEAASQQTAAGDGSELNTF